MTDRLTQLPAELFVDICELVHASRRRGSPYLGRIAKAFLPVARRLIFRKIFLTMYQDLGKLCDVVLASPGVAQYITELRLTFVAEDKGVPKTATLSYFFRQLVNLQTLTLAHSPRVSKLVLAPMSSRGALPRLVSIEVRDPLKDWANPFDPHNFRYLGNYGSLGYLHLEIPRNPDSLGRYRSPIQLPLLPPLDWVALKGFLSNNPAVPDLLASFEFIGGLSLHDDTVSNKATLPALLQAIPEPYFVNLLSLSQVPLDPLPVVEELARFPWLEGLELHRGTWTRAMLPFLQRADRLKALYFYPDTNVSVADLRDMIEGPARIKRLKTIYVNVLYWAEYDYDYGAWEGWSDDFTLEGVIDLLPVADAAGVELKRSCHCHGAGGGGEASPQRRSQQRATRARSGGPGRMKGFRTM